jgi:hypothetical protein
MTFNRTALAPKGIFPKILNGDLNRAVSWYSKSVTYFKDGIWENVVGLKVTKIIIAIMMVP